MAEAATIEKVVADDNEPLDVAVDTAQADDAGHDLADAGLEQAAPSLDDIAQSYGHKPKDDWKGDGWVDAATFMKRRLDKLQTLEQTTKRLERSNARIEAEARQRGYDQAKAELKAAVAEGDELRAEQAAEEIAKYRGPDPTVSDWVAKNPWFNDEPTAASFARSLTEKLARDGLSIPEQLNEVDREVRVRFPELFPSLRQEPARKPPVVQGGARGAAPANRARGFRDLTPAQRETYRTGGYADRFTEEQWFRACEKADGR